MKNTKKINEQNLREIIKGTILKCINENNDSGDVIYHQTPFDVNVLRSIFQKGLITNYNDEADCIWFAKNEVFYPNASEGYKVTLSVKFDKTFKSKHRYSDDGWEVLVYDTVFPDEIDIKDIPFCINKDNGKILMRTGKIDSYKKLLKLKGCNSMSEYIINNKQFKEQNIIIFSDIYENYVENGTLDILSQSENITLFNLFQ
jgi:predicted CopG family antitoxin